MALNKEAQAFLKRVEKAVSETQKFVGEKFVASARSTDTYTDQTANLRNSVGYVSSSPLGVLSDFGSGEGGSKGQQFAQRLVEGDTSLVFVAGMDYGVYVEAKGYDVISNSVNYARGEFEKLLPRALNAAI